MEDQNKPLWSLFILTFTVFLFCLTNSATAQTVPEIAEKALAATVYLEMQDSNGVTFGFGSGFFVRENLIATNYHVIKGAMYGTAKLVGKSTTYTIEGVTATDETNDLAILKVTVYEIKPLPLPLGNSDIVRIGEAVYVAGNPKGLEGTFSNGIISSLRDTSTKERLQMTAPISPGSSGGPVLNSKGEVIGVSFLTLVGGQNLNFAISVNLLKELLDRSGTVIPFTHVDPVRFAEVYFRWGKEKYKLGNYKNAIADYDMAIQLNPDHTDAYNNRGRAKHKLGQYAAAIADYTAAIQLKPDYSYTYIRRGFVKEKLGQLNAAIADYDTAIQLKPDFAFAYYNRGSVKVLLGRTYEAKQDFQTALRLAERTSDDKVKVLTKKVLKLIDQQNLKQ